MKFNNHVIILTFVDFCSDCTNIRECDHTCDEYVGFAFFIWFVQKARSDCWCHWHTGFWVWCVTIVAQGSECCGRAMDDIELLLKQQSTAGETCAVLIEPGIRAWQSPQSPTNLWASPIQTYIRVSNPHITPGYYLFTLKILPDALSRSRHHSFRHTEAPPPCLVNIWVGHHKIGHLLPTLFFLSVSSLWYFRCVSMKRADLEKFPIRAHETWNWSVLWSFSKCDSNRVRDGLMLIGALYNVN